MVHLNFNVLVPFCITGYDKIFMDALRCILGSISKENYPFKSHCFGAISYCENNTEAWVGDRPVRRPWPG